MRAWAGIAVAMAAALATLAPTTAGSENNRGPHGISPHAIPSPSPPDPAPEHALRAAARWPAPSEPERDEDQGRDPDQDQAQAQAQDRRPDRGAVSVAAPTVPGGPVVPVLPLGAGLTCLGLGLALIGLRLRQP